MHLFVLIPLTSCVIAAMIAGAIVARDPGQRANRVVAGILVCSAWWSLCEVVWNLESDPEIAVRWIRLSAAGWLWLGTLALAFVAEVVGDARSSLRRWLPVGFTVSALLVALFLLTPWGTAEAVPSGWGWSYRFGPLFPWAYALILLQVGWAVACWPRFLSGAAAGERLEARGLLAAFAVPLTVASLTDVVCPWFGVDAPRLGSTSLLVVGCVAGWSVRRHGYLLVAPGAFTVEILEALRDGVALVRPDGSIRSCNDALARLVGRPRDTVLDARVADLLPGPELAIGGHPDGREIELRAADGSTLPASIASRPLRDPRGRPVGEVLVLRDLREVTVLRNRLVTSGRLAAVGELAAGIAHEIANPISFVRSSLVQLRGHRETLAGLAAKPDADLDDLLSEIEELIEESLEGVERVASIVRDVATFSHAGRGRSELADLNQLLENALSVAVLSFSVIVERCYGDLPPVSCDPQQMKQVFLNLLLNAIRAVGDYGRIRLSTQRHGDFAVVRVEDDGPGIPAEDIHRVFDPFFTTRPAGEGLGLGLAHSYQIVSRHGGEISVRSKPGLGACFEVRLLVAGADAPVC